MTTIHLMHRYTGQPLCGRWRSVITGRKPTCKLCIAAACRMKRRDPVTKEILNSPTLIHCDRTCPTYIVHGGAFDVRATNCGECAYAMYQTREHRVIFHAIDSQRRSLCGRKGNVSAAAEYVTCKVCLRAIASRGGPMHKQVRTPKTHAQGKQGKALCGWRPSVYGYSWATAPTCQNCVDRAVWFEPGAAVTPSHAPGENGSAVCGATFGPTASPRWTAGPLEPPTCQACRAALADVGTVALSDATWVRLRRRQLGLDAADPRG